MNINELNYLKSPVMESEVEDHLHTCGRVEEVGSERQLLKSEEAAAEGNSSGCAFTPDLEKERTRRS